MAKRIGSIRLDSDSQKILQEMVDAVKEISDNMERTGTSSSLFLDNINKNADLQKNIIESLRTYSDISSNIINSLNNVVEKQQQILNIEKQKTDEVKKQRQEQEHSLETIRKQEEAEARKIAGKVMDPVGSAGSKLLGMIPGPYGKAAALLGGVALQGAAKDYEMMQEITLSGGQGAMEGLGLGGMASLDANIRMASARIPFLKQSYGSKEELAAGATTMYGLGGIRGDDLNAMMKDLPKMAHEAGMKFQDVANIMAKANRIYEDSPEQLKKSFEEVTKAAKEAGYHVGDYTKFVTDIAFKTAAYGKSVSDVNELTDKIYKETMKEIVSKEEVGSLILEESKLKKSNSEITEKLTKIIEEAGREHIRAIDVLKAENAASDVLVNQTEDRVAAEKIASQVTGQFASYLQNGVVSFEAFTKVLDTFHKNFGLGVDASQSYTLAMSEIASKAHYNKNELTSFGLELATSLTKITKDPKGAIEASQAFAVEFVDDLAALKVTSQDLNAILTTSVEKYRMSTAEAATMAKYMISLGEAANVPTSNVNQFFQQMTSGMLTMFNDPREAAKVTTEALGSTIKMLDIGRVSVNDYLSVMKTQMDVYGKNGREAATQFEVLAEVVDKTSIRMSELASYTSELSKINKQYGFDQTVSTAMLSVFNEGLRSGSVSLNELKIISKGAGGATEGFRATIYEQLMSQGGPAASLLSGMDPLTAITYGLGDIQRGNNLEAKNQVNQLFAQNIRGMTGGSLGALNKLAPAIFGSGIDNLYGEDLAKFAKIIQSGSPDAIMTEYNALMTKATQDKTNPQELINKSAVSFQNSTSEFAAAVNVFKESMNKGGAATRVRQGAAKTKNILAGMGIKEPAPVPPDPEDIGGNVPSSYR